jgi:hypothetical protein
MEDSLEERPEEPTENADLHFSLSRTGLTVTSKGQRITLLVATLLALVILPIFLGWLKVEHGLPTSLFIFADTLGTAAILTVLFLFASPRKRL